MSHRRTGSSRLRFILRDVIGLRGDPETATAAYEETFEAHLGFGGRAIAFGTGRSALYAILRSLDVGRDDEVILSAYTCHSVPRTIRATGARAVYVDIDPDNLGPDPAHVVQAVTPQTKAILVQHSFGWPARVDLIRETAARHGLPVIEDCCQTLGARLHDMPVGSFGVAAFFSSQWNKPYSTGQGGMAVVHDGELAERVRDFRDEHSALPNRMRRKTLAAELLAFELFMYPSTAAALTSAFRALSRVFGLHGGDSAMSDEEVRRELEHGEWPTTLQAVLGRLEVERHAQQSAQRRTTAEALRASLKTLGFAPLDRAADREEAPLRLPVRVRDPLAAIAAARRYGFELTTWFDVPLDPLAAYRPEPDYAPSACPRAEQAARQIVLVPLGRRITPRVVRRIERLFREHPELRIG